MQRRKLLQALAAAPIAMFAGRAWSTPPSNLKQVEALQKGWREFLAEGALVPSPTEAFKLSKDDWRKRLSPAAYEVLREDGTERPGTSALNDEKRAGIYACAGCGLPLFTSAMKYDSRTGWPSFFTTIPDALGTKTDYKIIYPRTEYHCRRCGGHHGHLFDDGPPPTRQRWCNNGVALTFLAKSSKPAA